MKTRVLITIIFLTSTFLVMQAQDVITNENINDDVFEQILATSDSVPDKAKDTDTAQSKSEYRYKEPGAAFFLSVLFPGLGQFYNGQKVKGIVMSGIHIGAPLGVISLLVYGHLDSDYHSYSDHNFHVALGMSLIVVWIGNWFWSVFDAPVSANKINRLNQVLSWDLGSGRKMSITPDVLSINSLGTKTTYHSPTYGLSVKLSF